MARVIVYVKSLEHGNFFVKDAKGNVHQLKAGEAIHEGELVYGSKSNPSNAQIIIDVTLQGAGDLVIAGNGALNFDTSLLKGIFSHDDAVVYVNSVKDALALAGGNITNVETDLRDGQPTNGDDETAAGQTLSNQEHASDTFNDRDGLVKDVRTSLNFTGSDVVEPAIESRPFRPVIVEEENIPIVTLSPSISINDVTVNEDAGTMSFTVSLSHATTAPVSFNYASANNSPISAAAGSDYTAVSGSGSIATGATTTTITVPISDDFIKEGNETFLMNLSNVSSNVSSSGNDLQGVGTITDAGSINPPTPEVPTTNDTVYAIISGPGATTEGDVTGNFTVSLVDMNGNPVTPTQDTDVTVVFSNGTAESGDYVATTQIVTILANSANATFTVQTNEDVDYDNETFVATIQSVEDTGEFEAVAVHATSGNVTATITDDDSAPSISINDVTVNEDAGTMSFTVSLSHATTAPVSFNYASANNSPISAAAGSDYTAVSGSGSIATGATTTTITVPISDDFIKEGNETFLMNLSNVSANVSSSGNDLQGVGTITDAGSINPPTPEVPTANDTVYAIISGPGATTEVDVTGNFTVSLVDMNGNPVTPTQDTDVTVVFSNGTAESGDYVATTQIVTILANSANATFTVQTNEEADYDNETFVATIQSVEDTGEFEAVAVHATSGNVTATITDDDTAPSISINDVTVNEDAGTMSFTVSLSHATTAPVSFNYASANNSPISAAAGSDYTAVSGSGSIATGATTTTITVPISDDFLKEGNETFLMNLSNVSSNVSSSGNDLQGVGTITDAGSINPPTPEVPTANDTVYAIISGPGATTEGDVTGNFTVSLVDMNGNPVTPTQDTDVTVVFSNGTAESGDYVATTQIVTILANSANATFTVQTNEDVDYDNETFVATIQSVEV